MTKFPADPYGRTTVYGHPSDNATAAAIHALEDVLGFTLTIYQIIGGAPQSAGTHLDGRAVDLAPARADEKLKAAKDMGFIGWHRPFDWDGRGGIEHIHLILVLFDRRNQRGLAPAGFRQIALYDEPLPGHPLGGRNGLVSNLPDHSYRATSKRAFQYPPKEVKPVPAPTNVTDARDELVHAMHRIDLACQALVKADPSRTVAKSQIDDLQKLKKQVHAVLDALPKR